MSLLARDTFTGGTTGDINGRTPDGGGSGPLAVGTWDFAARAAGASVIGITALGAQQSIETFGGVPRRVFYDLLSPGTWPNEYGVTVKGHFHNNTSNAGLNAPGFGVRVLGTANSQTSWGVELIRTTLKMYLAVAYQNWTHGSWIAAPAGTTLVTSPDGLSLPLADFPLDVDAELRVVVKNAKLYIYLNGVIQLVISDTTITSHAPGNPGFYILSQSAHQDVVVTDWSVDDLSDFVEPLGTCSSTFPMEAYIEDTFSGGDDTDIEGRTPDGDGFGEIAVGTWKDERPATQWFDIVSGEARIHYPDPDVQATYVVDGVDPLAAQSAEVTFQFHAYTTSPFGLLLLVGPVVRCLNDSETGYQFYARELGGEGLEFIIQNNRAASVSHAPWVLARSFYLTAGVPLNTDVTLRLCAKNNLLCGFFNGELVCMARDPFNEHTTGLQGMVAMDVMGTFVPPPSTRLGIRRFLSRSEQPGNGGGPGTPGTEALVWAVEAGEFRPATSPSPSTNALQPWDAGAPRDATGGWVMEAGGWRRFVEGDPGTNGDPGPPVPLDASCGQVPPPSGDPVDPIGDRIFFCYALPMNLLDPVTPFETYVDNTLANRIAGVISAAAAGGHRVYATQGGYLKFKVGGVKSGAYSPALMDAYIASFVGAPAAAIIAAVGTTFTMFQLFDDQHSIPQWNTIVAGTEVNRAILSMKSVLPGVPVGVRLTPRLAIAYGGPLDADFFLAQYHTRFGNVTTWANAEVAAAASLGKAIVFSLNFYNGGNGSSGIRGSSGWQMTAAEVLTYGSVLASYSESSGLGGWQHGPWLYTPGMLDSLVAIRNLMTAA